MKKNIIALIVLYNIKIHHWLKCSNKTLLNRSAVLSNFANKKMENPLPVPSFIYNLGQNKMKQKTPIPPKSRMKLREGQKTAPFSHPWFGGEGWSRFSIYFVQDCSWGPHSGRVFALWTSKWPPSERDLWILQFLVLSSLVWFDQSDKVLLLKVRKFSKHYGYI